MNIAIIGAGISGIAAASILNKAGHKTILFEKSDRPGGVWAVSYPSVTLQNTAHQYALSEFPWPFKPARHPTGAEIMKYLELGIEALGLDLRRRTEVVGMLENSDGWMVQYRDQDGTHEQQFDYVVSAIGQYTEGKHRPKFPGQETFKGGVITERDIKATGLFKGKRTAVVGFGKSAVDIAVMASAETDQVYHVFRTPRWLIPFSIFNIHYSRLLFSRLTTFFMPCWAYPSKLEQFVHTRMGFLVNAFWAFLTSQIVLLCKLRALFKGKEAHRRLDTLIPKHKLVGDLRSAAALAPKGYFRLVADGRVEPFHGEISHFSEEALHLQDGRAITCDEVALCVGSEKPSFPFLPEQYRRLLEGEHDGVQLYRHILHPDIPRFACAGYNHGFMHVPAAEVGTIWLCAHLNGDIALPPREEMLRSIDSTREWKRKYINFEPSRSCAVNTRFQQYIDMILRELGINPYRKMPNPLAEVFGQYGAKDYRNIVDEYLSKARKRTTPLPSLPLDT